MPEIVPNQKFKHDGKTYEKDKSYDVEPELAFYFKQVGWVGDNPPETGKVHELEVQDSVMGQKSEVK